MFTRNSTGYGNCEHRGGECPARDFPECGSNGQRCLIGFEVRVEAGTHFLPTITSPDTSHTVTWANPAESVLWSCRDKILQVGNSIQRGEIADWCQDQIEVTQFWQVRER